MSGPAIHYIVGQKLAEKFRELELKINEDEIAEILADPENQPYLNVGTWGPDFLFFNTKDWPVPAYQPVKFLLDGINSITKVEGIIMEKFPGLKRAVTLIKELEEHVIEESYFLNNLDKTLGDIKDTMSLIEGTIFQGLEKLAVQNIDFYELLLSHPFVNCDNNFNEWWWFDLLHYLKTGDFVETLLKNSVESRNPKAIAYAIGYLSHFSADTVGHPFVNRISGGPYRSFGQRHKVIENFQDVAAFRDYGYGEFVWSRLYEQFMFNDPIKLREGVYLDRAASILSELYTGHGDPASSSYESAPGFINIQLPDCILELFESTANQTYESIGKTITREEIDAAYRLWFHWFKKSTEQGALPTELEAPPPLDEQLKKYWDKIMDEAGELADAINDLLSGRWNPSWQGIKNFYKHLAQVIKSAFLVAARAVDFLLGAASEIPARAIHFILNETYKLIYSAYDYFRLSVCLYGYAFPRTSYLDNDFALHMTNPFAFADRSGFKLENDYSYPMIKLKRQGLLKFIEDESHLLYPQVGEGSGIFTGPENEQLPISPGAYFNYDSYRNYIDGAIQLDPRILDRLCEIGNEIEQYKLLEGHLIKAAALGNAVDLTAELMKRVLDGKPIPNLNLDADRGMAHPTWYPKECTMGERIFDPETVTPNLQ